MNPNFSKEKAQKIANFDPNGVGATNGALFGLPFTFEESSVIVIPVPWEVTVSYQTGTAVGPDAILAASSQLDLFDFDYPNGWQQGIFMLPISDEWQSKNQLLRPIAAQYIEQLEQGVAAQDKAEMESNRQKINEACSQLNAYVKQTALTILQAGKRPCVLGGEHSVPLGLLQALNEHYDDFGILQIDAHADLRIAYEGFTYSHASIMYNALQLPNISKLVSVGVRDLCHAEVEMAAQSGGRIVAYYDEVIQRQTKFTQQKSWHKLCQEIVSLLPDKVYISFDIDGLDPKLCPHTGTPVPGGLDFAQAMYLVQQVKQAGKQIIGFDLCEVAPDPSGNSEWDANVGARVLYGLGLRLGVSNFL